jgi:hypothetical protein
LLRLISGDKATDANASRGFVATEKIKAAQTRRFELFRELLQASNRKFSTGAKWLPALVVRNGIQFNELVGGILIRAFVTARNIVGIVSLVLAGYVLISSVPDVGRYIKISRM